MIVTLNFFSFNSVGFDFCRVWELFKNLNVSSAFLLCSWRFHCSSAFFVQNYAHSLGKTIISALYIIPFLPGKADTQRILQKFEQNSGWKKQINSEFLAEKQKKWPYFRNPQGVANILSFFQEFLIYFCPDFDIGCFKAVGSEQYS